MLLKTAFEVWQPVYESYATEKNIQRIYGLFEEVFLTKQGTKPLNKYYSFIKARWEELNIYQPYPTDIDIWKKQRDDLKVVAFLAGLSSTYASAKEQLLIGTELLNLNVAFSRL